MLQIKHLIIALLAINSLILSQSVRLSDIESITNDQLDKIKDELQSDQSNLDDTLVDDVNQSLESTVVSSPLEPEPPQINQYFGYEYFEREVNFFDNVPASRDFLLGPGDEVIVSLWGETNLRKVFTINRDGSIFYDNIGFINLANKNLREAELILFDKLSSIYSTLNTPDNSTKLSLEIGTIKSINVYFTGETASPGISLIHPFSDIFTALIHSGVELSGSLRKIQLIREGNLINTFDFYSFFVDGKDIFSSTRILDGDIIHIPTVSKRVQIEGEVVHPAYFEMLENESLSDLIKYSGSQTAQASTKILLDSIVPINKRSSDDNARINQIINLEEAANINLNDGDYIKITSIGDVARNVSVMGRVKFPKEYPANNSTLKDVLDLAGGFNDPMFRQSIRDDEILILRKDIDQYYGLEFSVSYAEADKFELIADDKIFVYENTKYDNLFSITVGGEVNKRGSYQFKEGMTIQDAINLAEGFSPMANKDAITISQNFTSIDRDGNKTTVSTQIKDIQLDFEITNNATVTVLPLENVVNIEGNVYNPGLIAYKKGKSVNEYIKLAGGYRENSLKSKVYIQRANGEIKSVVRGRLKNPRAGDTIIVPIDESPQNFDVNSFLIDILSVLTNLVAILAIADNNN